jgi:hypothetical protein
MVRDETRRARAESVAGAPPEPGGPAETDVTGPVDKEPVAAGDNGARDDA